MLVMVPLGSTHILQVGKVPLSITFWRVIEKHNHSNRWYIGTLILNSFALFFGCKSTHMEKKPTSTERAEHKCPHFADLLNTSQLCPQDKVTTRSRQRWTAGTGKGGGCQGWQSRRGPSDNSVHVRALESLAGCCFGGKVLVSDTAAASETHFSQQQQLPSPALPTLRRHQRHPTPFSRALSSDHWSSPLLLLILRQLLPWQKQLGPDYFPAPQPWDNRWLWKYWCVKHFHAS